jgi:hypothetical protein
VGVTLFSFGLVEAYAHTKMKHEGFVDFDAPELSFLSGDFKHIHLLRMTGYALGFIAVTVLLFAGWHALSRLDSPMWGKQLRAGIGLAALLGLNLAAMVSITNGISRVWESQQYSSGQASLVADAGVLPGSTIAEAADMPWQISQRQQEEVYWTALTTFNPGAGAPPGRPTYVITGVHRQSSWNEHRYGYTAVFASSEAGTTWVVWRRSR